MDDSDLSGIDTLVRLLHDSWGSGERPLDLRYQFDRRFTGLRTDHIVEVLLIDQSYRWQNGKEKSIEQYLEEFPEIEGNDQAKMDLIYGEYRIRRSHHDASSDVESLFVRFPDLADRLRQQLDVGQLFELSKVDASFMGEDVELATSVPMTLDATKTITTDRAPLSPGDFHIIRKLGAGAMGEVHLAVQKSLNKRVALKTLTRFPSIESELVDRFFREARAIASLSHPNIVNVHGIGEFPGRGYFLVMDLIDGQSLEERLRERKLSLEEAVGLVSQVAEAVDHAHQRGVIHRDLKPGNVLLDSTGRAVVTDFGLAKSFFEADADMSQDGQVIGTPSYMSPEQARGETSKVDARTDVYGLGALLYACLTSKPPFSGGSVAEVMAQVISDLPPKPITELRPDVPALLSRVCLKCLEKEADRRFATAAEVSLALGELGTTQSASTIENAGLRSPTHKLVWVLATAACFAIVAFFLLDHNQDTRIDQSPIQANWRVNVFREDLTAQPFNLLEQPGPLIDGDRLQVHLNLSRPCYPYLFWIDSEGNVQTLFTSNKTTGHVTKVQIPDHLSQAVPVQGPAGTEVLVAVLSEELINDPTYLVKQLRPKMAFLELAMDQPLVNGVPMDLPVKALDGAPLDDKTLAMLTQGGRALGDAEDLPTGSSGVNSVRFWHRDLPDDLGQTDFIAFKHLKTAKQTNEKQFQN